jgi:hypothetical protein
MTVAVLLIFGTPAAGVCAGIAVDAWLVLRALRRGETVNR